MAKSTLQQNMYELRDPSTAQRFTLVALIGACAVLAWWLLWGGGIAAAGACFGWSWKSGDALRRAFLAVALSIYFIRLLFTQFVFLKRGISWAEVFTIAPWVLFIYLLLAIMGGTNPATLGLAGAVGTILFLLGSWVNSYAEYQRNAWKQQAENRGKLYTLGLFRYTRHPNYFGDLLSFSGLCLIAGRWVTAIIPALMLSGFVFVNVPALDAHLGDRYGIAFEEYARKTRKLIPFLY